MKRKNMAAKILSALLTLCMLAGLATVSLYAADGYDGTQDNSWYEAGKTEYTVSSAAEFAAIAAIVNAGTDNFNGKTIKLSANIIFNEGDAETFAAVAPAYTFTPIGNGTHSFRGTLDGQGHTISGIYISGAADTGMFGFVEGATIKNLALVNSCIKGSDRIGAIAGRVNRAGSTFKDLYVNAYVISNSNATLASVGGICGNILNYAQGNIFERCVFAGEVTSNKPGVGGILGDDQGALNIAPEKTIPSKMIDCVNMGKVTGNANVGGIAGALSYTEVIGCLNAGEVNAAGWSGGIMGRNTKVVSEAGNTIVSVTGSYSCGDVLTGTAAYRGISVGNNAAAITSDCTEILSSQIVGAGAADVLTNFDFESVWAATRYGFPLPVTLSGMARGYTELKFKAVQNTEPAGGTYDVRFISAVNSLDFDAVGYTVTASYGEGQTREYKNLKSRTVYTALSAKDESTGTVVPVTAEELDGKYLIALSITDVPVEDGQITFTVKVFTVKDGVVYYSPAKKVIYNAGVAQS